MTARPNELSQPGMEPARERVEPLFRHVDRLGTLRERPLAPESRDPEQRGLALERLEHLADSHGRGALLDATRAAVRDALLARGSEGQLVGLDGLDARAAWSVRHEVAAVTAIEDAVAVAVMEDLLEPADAALLAAPGRRLLGLPALEPGASATLDRTQPAGDEVPDEPDEEDEDGSGAIDPRTRRAAVFVIIAVIALPAALSVGAASPSLPLLLVIAAAILLLTWLFG